MDSAKKHCCASVACSSNSECLRLTQDFISAQPMLWNEDIGE